MNDRLLRYISQYASIMMYGMIRKRNHISPISIKLSIDEYQDHHEEKCYFKGQVCQEKKDKKAKERKKRKEKKRKKF